MPGVKDLYTYDVPSDRPFPPIVERIVASGEKNPRIRIRKVDKSRFDEEAALHPLDPQRGLVGQLGLHPADRQRDRLCGQEAEADRARGHDPRRRI